MRRPDVFTLDYSHPLAQGLVFAGLGQMPGSTRYTDSSIVGNHGASGSARWYSNLGRQWLNQNGTFESIALTGAYPQFAEWTFSIWTDWTVKVSDHNVVLGGGGDAAYTFDAESNRILLRWVGDYHVMVYVTCMAMSGIWELDFIQSAFRGVHNLTFVKTATTAEFFLDGKTFGTRANTSQFIWNNLVSIGSETLGGNTYGGNLADPIIHNRALSPAEIALLADRTDPMLGGLVREVNPVAYFDFGGASAGTDNLTASDLVTGSPVLGTPALGQVHGLTATGLTVLAPVLGSPALGQVHGLTATGLTVSAPVLGTPTLTENLEDVDALTAQDLVVGSPVLGTPAIGQIHVLTALGLIVSSPVLGTPELDDGTDQPVIDRQTIGTIGGGTVYPIEEDDAAILQVIRKFLEVVDAQLG